MRTVFLGTPEFALPSLEAIVASPIEVEAVFTQPDRPAGRGRKLTPSPVKVRALELGLEVLQPERVRGADLTAFKPDAAVVVAYGQYLSGKLLSVPPLGGVNVHPSLLPRWRGAAPIQRALLAGDSESGVCTMRVAKEMDAGAILGKVVVPIGLRDTSEDLHDNLAEAGAGLLVDTLQRLERGEVVETEQDPALVTYAEKLTKEEARLGWTKSAAALGLLVRGLRPWPVAEPLWPGVDEGPVRIWCATAAVFSCKLSLSSRKAGQSTKRCLTVPTTSTPFSKHTKQLGWSARPSAKALSMHHPPVATVWAASAVPTLHWLALKNRRKEGVCR